LILRLAHRGDWRVAPENSIAALVAGAKAPRSDGVEFDVRFAVDGTPVLSHDRYLRRVQGLDRLVSTVSAEELAARGVATLAEALASFPADAFLDVEFKETPNAASATALIQARGPSPARAIVSAFDPEALRIAASLLPGWRRWLNVHELDHAAIATAREMGCAAIASEYHRITRATAAAVRAAGMELAAFTVRSHAPLERLDRLGVIAACVEGSILDA
jgi:glycerophosphoryl diester phosphodiesterase